MYTLYQVATTKQTGSHGNESSVFYAVHAKVL
jgi:hypothetical protein